MSFKKALNNVMRKGGKGKPASSKPGNSKGKSSCKKGC